MKIALLAPYNLNFLGGAEKYTLNLAKALMPIAEVYLYTDHFIDGYNCKKLAEAKNDFVDLCISQAIYGTIAMPKFKKRVHIFHGTILGNWYKRPWLLIHPAFLKWFFLEFMSLKGVDGVIAVSDTAKSEICQMGYRGPIKKLLSAGGFKNDKLQLKVRDWSELRLLFCGRANDKVKRFYWIKKAVALLVKQGIPVKLIVLGDLEDKQKKDSFIWSLGPSNKQVVLAWMNKSDLQINASFYEGCSLALAEGMYCANLPALATPTGGNLNQIIAGINGDFFINPADLAKRLKEVYIEKTFLKWRENLNYKCHIPCWEDLAKDLLAFAKSLF